MDQPVKDSIGNGGIADLFVPVFHGKLTGDDGGGMAVPFFNDLQEVSSFGVVHGSEAEIVEVPAVEYYGRGYQDIYTRKPSIAKARKLLDWEPRIDLETSLTRTIYSFLEENETDPGPEDRC